MRFYTVSHQHYCGIDLHTKVMYLCILNQAGEVLLHRNMKSEPQAFLAAIAPYREDLVVGAECIFCWYWLADLCAREGIRFVLGHALYMKAIHGGKVKNDKIDSAKIAGLLRGGMFPLAYVYPAAMRSTRDSHAPAPVSGAPARGALGPRAEHQQPVEPAAVREEARSQE